jgi:hypothetical protein
LFDDCSEGRKQNKPKREDETRKENTNAFHLLSFLLIVRSLLVVLYVLEAFESECGLETKQGGRWSGKEMKYLLSNKTRI